MTTKTGVLVKLFLGCELNTGIRIALDQNPAWKQQQVMPKEDSSLTIVSYQNKDFLGFYLPEPEVSVDELHRVQAGLIQSLREFLPNTAFEPHEIFIFTQSLIS